MTATPAAFRAVAQPSARSQGLPDAPLNWDDLRFFLEVVRTQRVGAAARRLGVEHTTVSRRIRTLEKSLGARLFDKSRASGFVLTPEGQRLVIHAEHAESAMLSACEEIAGVGHALSGHVRLGATEGFGSFFITPQLARFQRRYPHITLDILPVPRSVSLSKHEADLAIMIERPARGPYVCARLCDYTLRLYATASYLANHRPIERLADLKTHRFIGYVDELVFSDKLRYLDVAIPDSHVVLRSTSVIAQYTAALQGEALAILPCFLAEQDPRLIAVLPGQVDLTRSFWLYCHEELRQLKRIVALWDFLRDAAESNRGFLAGDGSSMTLMA